MSKLIKPNAFLSAEQLVEHSKKINEFVYVSRGNKLTSRDEDDDEPTAGTSEQCMNNLWELLRLERVLLSNKISKGAYEKDKNRVRVTKHCGKWHAGYHEENVNYLKPHEALHLMEMSRLEITFDTVIMSIEQAYAIFLDVDNEVKFEEYLVYSRLSRAGYFVFQHDPKLDLKKFQAAQSRSKVIKEDEMVWCVLMEQLNLPQSTNLITQEPQLYKQTKQTMAKLSEKIAGKPVKVEPDGSKEKRDLSPPEDPPSKRHKSEESPQPSTFLDILKNEAEYFNYQEIFKKFSFIKRAENFAPTERELTFHFDIFLPKQNFKKTEDLPSYRLIVVKSTDKFPTNTELELLRRQQSYELPIIIALVSESLTLHFCICTF